MPRQLLAAYPQKSPRFDEMLEAPLQPRAHWRGLFEHLVAASPDQMRRSVQYVQRQIHENGVTYNVYAAGDGASRPWMLDVLPAIVTAAEWDVLERELGQRARLLNAADLCDDQRCSRRHHPPALVFRHPVLRAAHGVRPPGGVFCTSSRSTSPGTPTALARHQRARKHRRASSAGESRTIARLFPTRRVLHTSARGILRRAAGRAPLQHRATTPCRWPLSHPDRSTDV
jgi:hypothetical protein